jgi:hypothetical protein
MAKIPEDLLAEWAENLALMSDGRVRKSALLAAAIAAQSEGRDLNKPAIRKAVIAEASPSAGIRVIGA